MWEPDPTWQEVAGAGGSSTLGVWRADVDGRRWIIKRLRRPSPQHAAAQEDVHHHAWWRREAEVVLAGTLTSSEGLVPAGPTQVTEDGDGISLWSPEVAVEPVPHDVLAHAYGRFATQKIDDPGWFTRGMLGHRLAATELVGGVRPLSEKAALPHPILVSCERVWRSRQALLDALDSLPQVLSHGDALPRNMLRHDGEHVVAVDWGQLGHNALGADLATLVLYSSMPFEDLVDAYSDGLGGAYDTDQVDVRRAVLTTATLIAVSRAARAVAAEHEVDGYLARLRKAEPLLAEVCGS